VTILLIGPRDRHASQIRRRLGGLARSVEVLKEGRKSVPAGYDVYVVWVEYVAHCQQEAARRSGGRMVLHKGGIAALVEKVLVELAA
jgi:hypothetical protein